MRTVLFVLLLATTMKAEESKGIIGIWVVDEEATLAYIKRAKEFDESLLKDTQKKIKYLLKL